MDDLINSNYRAFTLLGIATSIIMQHCKDEKAKQWFLNAINEVTYKNNPIPPLPLKD